MSGIPGSGKSTWVKNHCKDAVVCSADDYFMRSGRYRFVAGELTDAHVACTRKFVDAVMANLPLIVIDNTNTTTAEISTYFQVGSAYNYQLYLVTVECPPEVAAQRNIHGVSEENCYRMAEKIEGRKVPPFWRGMELIYVDGMG